jgi:hypothetical protein
VVIIESVCSQWFMRELLPEQHAVQQRQPLAQRGPGGWQRRFGVKAVAGVRPAGGLDYADLRSRMQKIVRSLATRTLCF